MFCTKKVWIIVTFFITTTTALASNLGTSLHNVINQNITIDDFRLQNGVILPKLRIAFETYGTLNASGSNAILITHGYTGNHHAAGFYQQGMAVPGSNASERGWWDTLIGPGKAIDTNRYYVISSNMLGSSYGTTNPASINPKTGKPYGPDFPQITIVDIIGAQRALLDVLGVKHLSAVAGWSYGGYLAFQWAVTYPSMMDSIVVAESTPKGIGNDQGVEKLRQQLAKDPNWNNGWYYDRGNVKDALIDIRVNALRLYGIKDNEEIHKLAEKWAEVFDANGLIVLRHAADYYDAQKDFSHIKAKVFYLLSTSDKLFPPSIAPGILAKLKDNGVDVTYFELNSDNGHLAASVDAEKWSSALDAFLRRSALPSP